MLQSKARQAVCERRTGMQGWKWTTVFQFEVVGGNNQIPEIKISILHLHLYLFRDRAAFNIEFPK